MGKQYRIQKNFCLSGRKHLHAVEWHTHARPVLYNHCQMAVSSSASYIEQYLSLDCGAHEHIQMALVPYADSQRCCYSLTLNLNVNFICFLFWKSVVPYDNCFLFCVRFEFVFFFFEWINFAYQWVRIFFVCCDWLWTGSKSKSQHKKIFQFLVNETKSWPHFERREREFCWYAYRLWAADRALNFDSQQMRNFPLWWCSCSSMCRPFSWYVVVRDSVGSFLRRILVIQLVSRRPMQHHICAKIDIQFIFYCHRFHREPIRRLTFGANENSRMWNFFPRIHQRIDCRREWCDRFHCPNIFRTNDAIPLATADPPCRHWLENVILYAFEWPFNWLCDISHSHAIGMFVKCWLEFRHVNGILTVHVTCAISTSPAYWPRDMCNCWPIMHTWIRLRTLHAQRIWRAIYVPVWECVHVIITNIIIMAKFNERIRTPHEHTQFNSIPKYLHVLWHIWSKIFDSPWSQYGMFVGGRFIRIISCGQNEAGFGLVHTCPTQVTIFQTRTLIKNSF